MALTGTAVAVRKPAIAAVRGSILTLHAAAGLATPVSREACRMLRASEGLARSALALLEATAKQPAASPAGQPDCGAKRSGRSLPGTASPATTGGKKGKGKGKGGSRQAEAPSGNSPASRSWVSAPSGALPMDLGAADLSDDEWADTAVLRGPRPPGGGACANDPEGSWRDSHSVVVGPAVAPPGWRAEQRGPPPGFALRTSARRTSSRSPRREAEAQPPATSAPPLVRGQPVSLQLLTSRPELNGERARLVELDSAAGRWVVQLLGSGVKVRVPPEKLQALQPLVPWGVLDKKPQS